MCETDPKLGSVFILEKIADKEKARTAGPEIRRLADSRWRAFAGSTV